MAALINQHGSRKAVVEYFYDGKIGNYYYGAGHPMKPHRVRLTHHLLLTTGLYRKMNVFCPSKATKDEMSRFHKGEYLDFLKIVNVDNIREFSSQMGKFNVGQDDCPMFDDLYEYCSLYTGGSLSGAVRINEGKSDVVINWSGGMHHAKKGEASGFCYVNDIVLAILELLKRHERVLYIDIDIHHGDGVEEAFYSTNRCMTLSFHQYGDFFPGTGNSDQIGVGEGKGYAINVPLQEGLDDQSFESIYRPIVDAVMQRYNPGAVVMCCGADSITGDRLGCWNLTIKGHAACIEYVRRFGKPVMLLGGGGYTPRNVARCWTYETSIVVGGDELDNDLPFNDYYEYFAPGYKLHLPTQKNLPNANGAAYLEETKRIALETLSQLEACPSVPIFTGQEGTTQIPRAGQDLDGRSSIRRDAYDPDSRVTGAMMGRREARGEYSSTKNNSAQLKEAALGWKTAPEGEPEEEGL